MIERDKIMWKILIGIAVWLVGIFLAWALVYGGSKRGKEFDKYQKEKGVKP